MKSLGIREQAVLIGFDADGEGVYSAVIPLAEYWDGEHVWDDDKQVKKLKLQRVVGFLFDKAGTLVQHFESTFDPKTGLFKKGSVKDAGEAPRKI